MNKIISKYPFLKGHEEFVSIVLQIRKEFNCTDGFIIRVGNNSVGNYSLPEKIIPTKPKRKWNNYK